jgi:thiol-disulfide isomerase/thioredoxin
MKWLDKIANVALMLGVAVFLYVVFHGDFIVRKSRPQPASALTGSSLKVPGLNFNQQHKSFVLAISTTCHFCKDSMPFYRELSMKTQGKVDLIAVLPQKVDEANVFLGSSSVMATKVVSASLDTLGVTGTPTLLLVDSQGKVQKEWMGELNDEQKKQVFAEIL